VAELIDSVSRTLAANVRAARLARGWRQHDLADRSGVSKGMIQQIETARTNPSIATVARLCDTLGIGFGELVEPPEGLGLVTRAADGVLRRCGRHGRSRAWLMVNDGRAPFLELWRFRLVPGDEVRSPGHPTGTRELIMVTEGALQVEVGAASFAVEAGDSLGMRGDRPHVYRNPGRVSTQLTMTVVYSGEQDSRFATNRW
jgi:transcriptional regulator with XRE-family HTH domain